MRRENNNRRPDTRGAGRTGSSFGRKPASRRYSAGEGSVEGSAADSSAKRNISKSPRGAKPFGKSSDERSFSKGPRGAKPFGRSEEKPFASKGRKPFGKGDKFGKPERSFRGENEWEEKAPRGNRSFGEKEFTGKRAYGMVKNFEECMTVRLCSSFSPQSF